MRILLLISIALMLPGCGYSRLALSKTQAFFHSTPENIKAAAPENCLIATGRISGNLDRNMPLAVAAVTRWETEKRVVDHCLLKSGSPFFYTCMRDTISFCCLQISITTLLLRKVS